VNKSEQKFMECLPQDVDDNVQFTIVRPTEWPWNLKHIKQLQQQK